MELWLPPTPLSGMPLLRLLFQLYTCALRGRWYRSAASVVPYVLVKTVDASTSRSGVRACWWIPTGGTVLLCWHSCIVSDFKVSRCGNCCIDWLRFEQSSKPTLDSTMTQGFPCIPARRQLWWLWWFGSGFLVPGFPAPSWARRAASNPLVTVRVSWTADE